MKPIDDFSFIKANRIDLSSQSLMTYYYPIIGQEAFVAYHYLVTFWDDGRQKHKFSEILNHTLLGMLSFEKALATLTAMDLVVFFKQRESYLIQLKSPLSGQEFLKVPHYRQMLVQKIGEVAIKELEVAIPENSHDISKRFSDVFDDQGEVTLSMGVSDAKSSFDIEAFKNLMVRDGLSFSNEKTDVIGLYRLSETYQMTWYDTYLLAKETAYKLTISLSRMRAKKEQEQVSQQTGNELTPQEKILVTEAQADRTEVFLAKIKKARKATITADERRLVSELAEIGFLDEVINVILLYTITKNKSANINKLYAQKLANDLSYHGIKTAEAAVIKLRQPSSYAKNQKGKTKVSSPQKSNVPEWSNQDYQNQTSEEEQKRLEEAKRKAMERLRKD